jgi:hypothetical protein
MIFHVVFWFPLVFLHRGFFMRKCWLLYTLTPNLIDKANICER